jgi:dTDP-4-dehydrorhamnose reductase
MKNGKIAVLGSKGMAGHAISKYLLDQGKFEVITVSRNKPCSIGATISSVHEMMLKEQPDYVVNCIGLIKQREGQLVDHLETNGMFPIWLTSTFKDTKVIHLSSDCVFSGNLTPGSSYQISDQTDSCDDYGISKSVGEQCWKLGALVIRTSIIGIEEQNNKGLVEWVLRENKEVLDGYSNHLWNGVLTTELARIVENLITIDWHSPRIIQLGSPEFVSKFQLVEMITTMLSQFEKTPFKKTVKPIKHEKTINRVLKSGFNTKTLFEQFLDHKNFMLRHNMDKRP